MKRLLSLTLMMVLALASTSSFAIDFSRWWQPKHNAQERAIPQGQEHAQTLIQESSSNSIGTLPVVAEAQSQIQKAKDYATQKEGCGGAVTSCTESALKMAGIPFVQSGPIDACIALYSSCKGVHVCDKNGETLPAPEVMSDKQSPVPYLYDKMTCLKQKKYETTEGSYQNYFIIGKSSCNPAIDPSKNEKVKVQFSFTPTQNPDVTVCYTKESPVKGLVDAEYADVDYLNQIFSITTLDKYVDAAFKFFDKHQADKVDGKYVYWENYNHLLALKKMSPEELAYKEICMLSYPTTNGEQFAGYVRNSAEDFGDDACIMILSDQTKLCLNKMAYFPSIPTGPLTNKDPKRKCVVDFTIKHQK